MAGGEYTCVADVPEGGIVQYPSQPFTRAGRTWFRLDDLVHVGKLRELKLSRRQLLQHLRALGAETHTMRAMGRDGQPTTYRFIGVAPDQGALPLTRACESDEASNETDVNG